MTTRTGRAVLTAAEAILLAFAAGCGRATSGPQKYIPVPAAARAYLRTHFAPARPGMIAGIVTSPTAEWTWPCRSGRGSVGGQGTCNAWVGQLMTPDGRTVSFACGRATAGGASPSAEQLGAAVTGWVPCTDSSYVPNPGDYVYVPASLEVSGSAPVQVIRSNVIEVWSCPAHAGRSCPWMQGVPVAAGVAQR